MEFRFSDDFSKGRSSVANIYAFTCPCMHTPSAGTLPSHYYLLRETTPVVASAKRAVADPGFLEGSPRISHSQGSSAEVKGSCVGIAKEAMLPLLY